MLALVDWNRSRRFVDLAIAALAARWFRGLDGLREFLTKHDAEVTTNFC